MPPISQVYPESRGQGSQGRAVQEVICFRPRSKAEKSGGWMGEEVASGEKPEPLGRKDSHGEMGEQTLGPWLPRVPAPLLGWEFLNE